MAITVEQVKKVARETGNVTVGLYSGANVSCQYDGRAYYWWVNRVFDNQPSGRCGAEHAYEFINYYGRSAAEKAHDDAQYSSVCHSVFEGD